MSKENKKVEVNEETGEVKDVEIVHDVFETNPGSRIKMVLKWKWSDEHKQMVPYYDEEKLDTYKMIQASVPSCDIVAIFNRAMLGDISKINLANPEMYNWGDADVSEVPTDINSYNELRKVTLGSWNQVDPKVRAIFGNSFEAFSNAFNDGSFNDIINKALSTTKVEDKKEEKKVSEN